MMQLHPRGVRAPAGPMTRPTIPPGAMTAMSACTPSALPRSIVTVRMPGFGFPAITSAASVGSVALRLQVQQLLQLLGARRQRALLLQLHLELRHPPLAAPRSRPARRAAPT